MQNGNSHQRQRPLPSWQRQPPASDDQQFHRRENQRSNRRSTRSRAIKGSVRGARSPTLNALADTLRQVQRERRLSEREIRSVRDTLKSLQTVRL